MEYKKKVINSQNDLKIIKRTKERLEVIAKRGPSKKTTIPLKIEEKMAFLCGTIIGDGHLKKKKLQITLENTNLKLIDAIKGITKELFNRKFKYTLRKKRKNKKQSWEIRIDSKAIYNLMLIVFKIPSGKKSDIVKIPFEFKRGKNSIKAAFLIGIIVTEGGYRKRGYGLTTASKQLRDNVVKLLNDLKIKALKDEWTNKKYNKKYYGLSFRKEEKKKIILACKDKKVRKIIDLCQNLM